MPQLRHQLGKPQGVARRLNADQRRLGQVRIERPNLSVDVIQSAPLKFSGLRVQHSDPLVASVKVIAYNQHVSAPPLGWIDLISITNLTTLEEPTTLCDQTAAFAVCGFSSSPGEKTRTAKAAVRATRRMKTNRRCARNSGSYEDNLRFPIRIEGHARGRALRFVFGRRRRRRLTARAIPLVPQTAAFAVCGFSPSPGEKTRTAKAAVRATRRMKTNRRCARNSGSYEDNLRFPIRIEGNARGRALRFVFGQRRRRRLTARAIPLVPQTAALAVCGLCDIGRDFVAQTAAFVVCGRSSSSGEKTRTAETAVRATAILTHDDFSHNLSFLLTGQPVFPGGRRTSLRRMLVMKRKRLSIGSWAYCFGPYKDNPVPFDTVIEKLGKLGFDGVELGGFPPHPNPNELDTKAKRQELKKKVADHGLQFSGLAADLWSFPIIPVADNSAWMSAFERNVEFAKDLGIDCIRVDTVSPPDIFEKEKIDPKDGWERVTKAFRAAAARAADEGIRVVWEFEPGFAFNKPSEIIRMPDAVGHKNFSVLFDTCHGHICAALGARQPGEKETLPGGALELLKRLQGKIGHFHLIDSDNTLHQNETSTHAPFGQGVLNFDELVPEMLRSGCPSDWWTIDLCFWPDAWNVTADAKVFLDRLQQKFVQEEAEAKSN